MLQWHHGWIVYWIQTSKQISRTTRWKDNFGIRSSVLFDNFLFLGLLLSVRPFLYRWHFSRKISLRTFTLYRINHHIFARVSFLNEKFSFELLLLFLFVSLVLCMCVGLISNSNSTKITKSKIKKIKKIKKWEEKQEKKEGGEKYPT